ncbi:PfkB family carbohydrate kinase [Ammoniphilus sp. YIM 78166]|uniref:PfkB family carbohydrate kinase n=1 Tax=Ammoniphilus sp. YIM 78166 TaxID=1644106 RepID=UPI00106F8C9E|nr:PfkB family carbohydrate kinase [Ammoniphilus sp. YIM 78166]
MKVVGFGDNVADVYIHTRTRYPGGNSVNFAVYAKQLGIPSAYMGVFGTDEIADFIQRELREIGIDLSHCERREGENGIAKVNLVDGDRVFVGGNGGGISVQCPLRLTQDGLRYLSEFDLIHSGCYANMESELARLRELNGLVAFDFSEEASHREEAYLQRVCPYIDFALFSGSQLPDEEIQQLVERVRAYGVVHVLVTRGVKGPLFFSSGNEVFEGRVELIDAVDTMGAGDSFLTAFLIHLVQNGWSKTSGPSSQAIEEGLRKAATFSAQTCLIDGAFGHGQKY